MLGEHMNRRMKMPKQNPEDEKQPTTLTLTKEYRFVAVMNGRATSQETATGRVTIVRSKEDMARVREGAVVVSRTASPNLSLVMSKASAIITEQGGQTAIASKLARAMGIPALVGVAGLMEAVAEGDLVRVDGMKETMEILEFAA